MQPSTLTLLTLAGVVERAGNGRSVLRVTPRFLAHAEGTAGRLRMLGMPRNAEGVLEATLEEWAPTVPPRSGAGLLRDLLDDQGQLDGLQSHFLAPTHVDLASSPMTS